MNRNRQQANGSDDESAPITDIIGAKLPPRLSRRVKPEHYALLRECRPFGSKPVRQMATELGIQPKRLWRWLHRCRLELEFELLALIPQRALAILQCGRDLREEGAKFESAEAFLKRLVEQLDRLPLDRPLKLRISAECNLDLGHICRDRGTQRHRWQGVRYYGASQTAFVELENSAGGPWRDPQVTSGRFVAAKSVMEMHKIAATYAISQREALLSRNVKGLQDMLSALPQPVSDIPQYRERRAETMKLLGENLSRVGRAEEGLKYGQLACDVNDGGQGDLLSRRLRRAETLIELRRFDAALVALEEAEKGLPTVDKERGTHKVLIDKAYCRLYKYSSDYSALQERARTALGSARRLGLRDQAFKIGCLISGV